MGGGRDIGDGGGIRSRRATSVDAGVGGNEPHPPHPITQPWTRAHLDRREAATGLGTTRIRGHGGANMARGERGQRAQGEARGSLRLRVRNIHTGTARSTRTTAGPNGPVLLGGHSL
ncbi:hypothetical protein B0H11DRAFT_1934978 [Mycena galericulata]|nr:hypothetical protein B0H11DRAFT_1934978 [Mycena galericulata]